MSRCNRCNQLTVEKIESGEMVCVSCGLVHDDFVLGESSIPSGKFCSKTKGLLPLGDQKVPAFIRQKSHRPISNNINCCLEVIKKLSSQCKLGSETCSQIESLFLKIYPHYKLRKMNFKVLLAGCCVYFVSKTTGSRIFITEFCKALECEPKKFYSVYVKLRKELNSPGECTSISFEDNILAVFKNMPRENQDERQEHCALVKKTAELMEFVKECWLVTGRSVHASAMACAYFAWKMLNLVRLQYTFEYFYELCKFEGKKEVALQRVREMTSLFIKLGKCLPYIDETELCKRNIAAFLGDIMKYRQHIFTNLLHSSMQSGNEDKDKKMFEILRSQKKTVAQSLPDYSQNECSTNCCGSDDEVIPDSEWDLYLRSDEEIRCLKSTCNFTET